MKPEEVEKVVIQKKLCFSCLNSSHRLKNCTSQSRCKTCSGKHHTFLHKGNNEQPRLSPKPEEKPEEVKNFSIRRGKSEGDNTDRLLLVKYSAFVIPATIVTPESGTLVYHDQGADETWVSSALAEKLGLRPIANTDVNITTVTGQETFKKTPIVELQSCNLEVIEKLNCRVMDVLPQCTFQNLAKVFNLSKGCSTA